MRYIKWGIILALIGAITGGLIATFTPVKYESSLSFTVNQINKQATTTYQYDGYYAIQASDLFSETIVSWFQTPSFLLEVYNRAGIDPQINSIDSFTARFKMKKYSAQNLVLEFTAPDREQAEKLSEAIIAHVEERSGVLNQNADLKALFEVKGSAPVIVKKETTTLMGALYGLVAGIAAGIFVIALFSAFRKLETENS
ncbi:MAG: hypothetical protein WC495_00215 [Patescibacteria group bacterium]